MTRPRSPIGLRRTLRELRQAVARCHARGERYHLPDTAASQHWNLNDGGFLRVRYTTAPLPTIERLSTYGQVVARYVVKE